MADVILGGDFTVFYTADNNRKQIKWTGSATGTRSANALYSALQDLFDELAQMDDGIPMSAQTPTEYTIGAIDASDNVPWFIDDETIQRITGGAIKTSLWTRVTGIQAGIIRVAVSANTSVAYSNIGATVTATAGSTSTGVLVDFRGAGATSVLFIRPASNAIANDFTGATTITAGANTTGVMVSTVTTGEALWANIYSLGSIAVDKGNNPITDLYVYKSGAKVTALSAGVSSYQWWPTGHMDILMKVKEPGATPFTGTTAAASNTITAMSINAGLLRVGQPIFGSAIPAGTTVTSITSINSITMSVNATGVSTNIYANTIDAAYVTVFAREYNNVYDYFTVDLNSGGRNPIPLATGGDLNNYTGLRQLTASAGTGTFQVGETVYVGASLITATAKGVVTGVIGTGATSVITYYLTGNLTDFTGGAQAVTGAVSAATITTGTVATNPAANNPASLSGTGFGITFGAFTDDINNGNGSKQFAIRIDPGSNKYPLATMYEWTKFATRRGSVDTVNNNGINGERYIGAEYILTYSTAAGATYGAGTVVFQASTGAYGVVVAHDNVATSKYVLVRNVRGAFTTSAVTDGTTVVTPTAASTVTPIKPNPYGTFAGGKFFAAPGVHFNRANLAVTDIQAYQLTALDNTVQVPPNIVSVALTGLAVGDGTGVFRTTAGSIVKDAYTMPATTTTGGTSLVVTSGSRIAIASDEPQAGFLRVVKTISTGITAEHRYRYSSWSGTTFTFATVTAGQGAALTAAVATATGNLVTVTLGTAISTAQVQVGDMVYTHASATPGTPLSSGAIVSITSTTTIVVRDLSATPTLANWSGVGNNIAFNKVAQTYAATDKIYVPIIDSFISAGTSTSNSLIYNADITVLVRVRQFKNIQPFEQSTTVGNTGLSVSAIRTSDAIAT